MKESGRDVRILLEDGVEGDVHVEGSRAVGANGGDDDVGGESGGRRGGGNARLGIGGERVESLLPVLVVLVLLEDGEEEGSHTRRRRHFWRWVRT